MKIGPSLDGAAALVDQNVARMVDVMDGTVDGTKLTPSEVNAKLIEYSTQLNVAKEAMKKLENAYALR
jgi:hypothetical protein